MGPSHLEMRRDAPSRAGPFAPESEAGGRAAWEGTAEGSVGCFMRKRSWVGKVGASPATVAVRASVRAGNEAGKGFDKACRVLVLCKALTWCLLENVSRERRFVKTC